MVTLKTAIPGAFWGEVIRMAVSVTIFRNKMTGIVIAGLSAGSTTETADRLRTALDGACDKMGFPRIEGRIVIDVKREDDQPPSTVAMRYSAVLDFAMAVGTMIQAGHLPDTLVDACFLGAFHRRDDLRSVNSGWISLIQSAQGRPVYIPAAVENTALAQTCSAGNVHMAASLTALLTDNTERLTAKATRLPPSSAFSLTYDLADNSQGHGQAIRAAEIAAAGRHVLVLKGQGGRSWLARRAIGILPPLEEHERLQLLTVHDAAGLQPDAQMGRPFRAPHYSVSGPGLRSEALLAQHGVLFLDDVAEYSRTSLEALADVLRDSIGKDIFLIISANDCPCGVPQTCTCRAEDRERYQQRCTRNILLLTRTSRRGVLQGQMGVGEASGVSSADLQVRVMAARWRRLERDTALMLAATLEGRIAVTIAHLAGRASPEWQDIHEASFHALPGADAPPTLDEVEVAQ